MSKKCLEIQNCDENKDFISNFIYFNVPIVYIYFTHVFQSYPKRCYIRYCEFKLQVKVPVKNFLHQCFRDCITDLVFSFRIPL